MDIIIWYKFIPLQILYDWYEFFYKNPRLKSQLSSIINNLISIN